MSEADVAVKPVEATEPVVDNQTTQAEETKKDAGVLKTTARTDYKNFKNNRKFDPSALEVTDDADAIRKQVRKNHPTRPPSSQLYRFFTILEANRLTKCFPNDLG